MTKKELTYLKNLSIEQIRTIQNNPEFCSDDYTIYQICLKEHIEPNYKKYNKNDTLIKIFKEIIVYPQNEIIGLNISKRDIIINEILNDDNVSDNFDKNDDFFKNL